MKKLITHNGKYHLDDVFACATLELILDKEGGSYEITRTREKSIIDQGDFVFDVGDIYDPEKNRFDHHQKGVVVERANGIPYAAFGLVWKKFGKELCGDQAMADLIDTEMVCGIDAVDNGIDIVTKIYPDIDRISFGDLAESFIPSWKESDSAGFDTAFLQIVSIAKDFLRRQIIKKQDKAEAEAIVESIYQNSEDKRLIVLDRYYPGKGVLATHPEPLFVVFPNDMDQSWMAITVRDEDASYVNRKDFPSEWGGLRGNDLVRESGVDDALFCHRGLWLVTSKSKEGAIELARKAINA